MTDLPMRATMWAEMKPDCYGGEKCDEIVPRWKGYAEGDKDSDTLDVIELAARTFPPGTKVVVREPTCPDCGELRSPIFDPSNEKRHGTFADKCDCGFDWDTWVRDQYS